MTAPRYADLASKALKRVHEDDAGPVSSPSPAARAAAIAVAERALRVRALARRRRRNVGVLSAVAAVLVVGLATARYATRHHDDALASAARTHDPVAAASVSDVSSQQVTMVGHPTGAGATVESEGQAAPLVEGSVLRLGSRVVTEPNAGGVSLTLSTGTKLSLTQGAELSLEGQGPTEIFALRGGSVRAEVAKLSGPQRFLVRTSDTEVEVRGTVFQVSEVAQALLKKETAALCSSTPTRVAVTEGVVVVRHEGAEVRISAGQRWPDGCIDGAPRLAPSSQRVAAAGAKSATPPAAGPLMPSTPSAVSSPVEPTEVRGVPAPSNALAQQNDLFERASKARRAGAFQEAADEFAQLVKAYPNGPLAENAAASRMRVLVKVDATAAGAAARDYLARYPNGFARTEAQTIADRVK